MITIFIFLSGLLVGSFLNVCIYRIPGGESISFPPSHCTDCGGRIKPYDLIPLLSYAVLGGKCRFCGCSISLQYPLVELLTGLLFTALYLKFGLTFALYKGMIFFGLLIVISIIDLKTTDIYFRVTLPGILTGLILAGAGYSLTLQSGFWSYIIGGLAGGGLIAVLILLTGGMGWGDAELCLLCGLYLGLPLTAAMLLIAFVTGGIVGVSLMLLRKKGRKDMIPFGPFLAAGSAIAYLFGQELVQFYMIYYDSFF